MSALEHTAKNRLQHDMIVVIEILLFNLVLYTEKGIDTVTEAHE